MNTHLDAQVAELEARGYSLRLLQQPDGWTFAVIADFLLPPGSYSRPTTDVLIKLPPSYPFAALDMFWVQPQLHTATGALPANTSDESVMGQAWQRFSWHPTQWQIGRDTLLTFIGFITRRFELGN